MANTIASGALWLIGTGATSYCSKLTRESNSALHLLRETNIIELVMFVQRELSAACSWPVAYKRARFLRLMRKLNASLLLWMW